jgi:hypothetical protein
MQRPFLVLIALILAIVALAFWVREVAPEQEVIPPPAQNDELRVYQNAEYGFSFEYPPELEVGAASASYLLPDTWSVFADPENPDAGVPVVSLMYPGSNEVLSAEMRVGVSTDPETVVACTTAPYDGVLAETDTLNGNQVVALSQSSAAMNHVSHVRAYRIVHDGACYSIERILYGTNPEVYDPPREVPFAQATAESVIDSVSDTFQFTTE